MNRANVYPGKHDVSGMHVHNHNHHSLGSRKGRSAFGSNGGSTVGRMKSQTSIIPEGSE